MKSNVFSIIPEFEIYSPAKGDRLEAGTIFPIKWDTDGIVEESVEIRFSADGGEVWEKIVITVNDGMYQFEVPKYIESDNCVIEIRGVKL